LDLPGGNFGAGYPWWKVSLYKAFASKGQNIHLVRSDSRSQETYKKVEEILNGRKIDFLFIDGDHTYQGAKEDFESYYRLMSKEGMIGFHDIIPNSFDVDIQVHQLWGEIKDKYKTQEIVEDYQQNKAGIGVIQLNL
jgi:predicted O-methyltransferase YrrM